MNISIEALAQRIMQRCDQFATHSEESGCLVRRFATEPMRLVNALVESWMREAGMTVWQDNIGNLVGRYEGAQADAATLLLGSHLDTVRDAGKYDGPLGVLVALACVELLHAQQRHLPFALEIYAFADEEGLRYYTSYLGSQVVTGTLARETLERVDSDGISLAEAIRTFGGNPDALHTSKRGVDDLLGYCEVHIEQGPVLEAKNLPTGIVSTITGSSRILVSFTGQAGHAGTVPMHLRRDALCAAAEFVLAAERTARAIPGLVATVGQVKVEPGASNVIPGHVTLSLDVRHMDDATRAQARDQIFADARRIARQRSVEMNWQISQEHVAVPCDSHLQQLLAQAIERNGLPVHTLPSGAGHDGVMLSTITRIAMLFVRCAGGISHNPAEAVTPDDVAVAIRVMDQFLLLLAREIEAKE